MVCFDPARLINELSILGVDVFYDSPNFLDGERYATIYMTASQEIADSIIGRIFIEGEKVTDRLLGEINRVLSCRNEINGAFLRRVDYFILDGKISYAAEIVPFKHVKGSEDGRDRRVIATENFLKGLVSVVRNFKQKNPHKQKR